jgi:HD-like signal output (HDOD) protein
MKRILFVDDDLNLLDGLRRALRTCRDEWSMEFVTSAPEALTRLAESSFDVIVTDMRMPGMDGAELLNIVRDCHPDVIRVILSGQSDQESLQRSIGRTHQYLSKPCNFELLSATIRRSCNLRHQLGNQSLNRLISQTAALPSLPDVYSRVLDEINCAEPCMQSIAELISRDVAMSAGLLRLVNSSFFGLRQRVESPAFAAALLGLNVLRPLVLSAGMFSQFNTLSAHRFSIDAFSKHCLAVSHAARVIAQRAGVSKETVDDAQMAGMVHDIGQLLFASRLEKQYDVALHQIQEEGRPACEVELELIGADHAAAGGHLLALWGLPDPIVEAAALHHCPSESVVNEFAPLTAVHVANAVISDTHYASPASGPTEPDMNYLERIGWAMRYDEMREAILQTLAVKRAV